MTAADRLAEIEARIEAATPGPWTAAEADLGGQPASDWVRDLLAKREADGTSSGRLFLTVAPNDIDPEKGNTVTPSLTGNGPRSEVNAAFIAHARTDLPATVEALRAVLALHEDRPANLPSLVERGMRFCRHCDNIFPCPTVRAITDALGGAA